MFGNRKLREARAEAEKWQKRALKAEDRLKILTTRDAKGRFIKPEQVA